MSFARDTTRSLKVLVAFVSLPMLFLLLPVHFYDQAIVVNGLHQRAALSQRENSSTVATGSCFTSMDITIDSNRDTDAISSAGGVKDALSRLLVCLSVDSTVDLMNVRRLD